MRLGLVHDPALGVALLVGRHVEGDRVEHPQLELGREGDDDPSGPSSRRLAVTGK